MFKSLAGRTVIVTGGTKGIGKGIVRRFAEVGCNVMIVSRNAADGEAVAAELATVGGTLAAVGADISTPEGAKAMAAATLARFGTIDILCANAGIFPAAKLASMTVEEFDHVMNTNMRGTFLSVSACLPALKVSGRGRIILTSSITGPITGFPGWSHYGASKAAQLGFMRTAAIELAPSGITVNAVMPGNIFTEGLEGLGPEYIAGMEASIPQRRLGSVADIANAALFFATEEAAYITGQGMVIDGGQILPESPAAMAEMDVA